MARTTVECSFLIPIRRDSILSDGRSHPRKAWEWLDNELYARFGGLTLALGKYQGFYQDPDTGARVGDRSFRFIVAIPKGKVNELRRLLGAACVIFAQKCIYLSVAGIVEFVEVKHGDSS